MLEFLRRARNTLRRRARQARTAKVDPAPYCETFDGAVVPPLAEGARVVILKLDHVGDFILDLPALTRLRAELADVHITLICGSWNRALAEASGVADAVITHDFLPSRGGDAGDGPIPKAKYEQFGRLAAGLGRFDLAIDLRLSPDTRPLLAAIDASVRAGYADVWTGTAALDIAVAVTADGEVDPRRGHTLQEQTRAQLLIAAVLNLVRPPARPAAALVRPSGVSLPAGPYMAVAPGAGTSIKIWSAERLARAVAAIAEHHDLRVVILALPAEADLAARLRRALPPERVSDLTGRTGMNELPAIIDGARLYIGMDSGLTHLAAALDAPTLCIFSGATRKAAWRPVGPKVRVVRGGAACSPCFLAHREQCPHDMACLSAVGVEAVTAAAASLLAQPR